MADVSTSNATNVSLYDELGQRTGTTANPLASTAVNNLIVQQYDALALTYNLAGDVSTVRYYVGGINGTLVATLTLGYDLLGNLTTVART